MLKNSACMSRVVGSYQAGQSGYSLAPGKVWPVSIHIDLPVPLQTLNSYLMRRLGIITKVSIACSSAMILNLLYRYLYYRVRIASPRQNIRTLHRTCPIFGRLRIKFRFANKAACGIRRSTASCR